MKRMASILLIVVVAALGTASLSQANVTPSTAMFLFLGERAFEDFTGPGLEDVWYRVHLVAGRSYTFFAWAPLSLGDGTVSLTLYEDDGTTVVSSGVFSPDVEPAINMTGHGGDQKSIIPTRTGLYFVLTTNLDSIAHTLHTLGIETSLFSPWYFVDRGNGYEAYVEIRNSTNSSISVTVTAYHPTGSAVGTTTQIIAGNGKTVVASGATLGVADGSGSVQIAHSGTPGAIAANITTLSATTGLSFDSPFTPRMVWGTFITY